MILLAAADAQTRTGGWAWCLLAFLLVGLALIGASRPKK